MTEAVKLRTVIKTEVAQLVTISLERLGKISHGGKKTAQFLNMMFNVSSFLM